MSIIAPMAAMIIQKAVSRSREYLADATGAAIAGSPEGLARALEKLGAYSRRIPMDANPSTAHMFIVNPLSGKSLQSLFVLTLARVQHAEIGPGPLMLRIPVNRLPESVLRGIPVASQIIGVAEIVQHHWRNRTLFQGQLVIGNGQRMIVIDVTDDAQPVLGPPATALQAHRLFQHLPG